MSVDESSKSSTRLRKQGRNPLMIWWFSADKCKQTFPDTPRILKCVQPIKLLLLTLFNLSHQLELMLNSCGVHSHFLWCWYSLVLSKCILKTEQGSEGKVSQSRRWFVISGIFIRHETKLHIIQYYWSVITLTTKYNIKLSPNQISIVSVLVCQKYHTKAKNKTCDETNKLDHYSRVSIKNNKQVEISLRRLSDLSICGWPSGWQFYNFSLFFLLSFYQ